MINLQIFRILILALNIQMTGKGLYTFP